MVSNDEMEYILKIVEYLENSEILLKGVSETIKNEPKEQSGGFLSTLLGVLGSTLLSRMLTEKGFIRADYGSKGQETIRAGYGSKVFVRKILIPPHPLTNFEIEVYYQNEPRFNGVYSRDNLPKIIKNRAYVINLDESADIGTHWVALFVNKKTVAYLDSFGVEHIPKEIKKFINNKNIIANIFRLQAYDLVMCGYFCIGFIDFMLKGNTLTGYANLFSPNNLKENDNIILNYFLTNL